MKHEHWLVAAALGALVFVGCGDAPSPAATATATLLGTNLLANADFAQPSSLAQSQNGHPTFTGNETGASAAAAWESCNGTITSVVTAADLAQAGIPAHAGQNATGTLLHVQVPNTYLPCGIAQLFTPPGTGPRDVVTDTWIYSQCGMVGVGTGNAGATGADVVTGDQGRWIHIQTTNHSWPASETIVYASFGEYVGRCAGDLRDNDTGDPNFFQDSPFTDYYVDRVETYASPNLLTNVAFATPAPGVAPGAPATCAATGPGFVGGTAVAGWSCFEATDSLARTLPAAATITTQIGPGDQWGLYPSSLRVSTTRDSAGIFQVFPAETATLASALVKVTRGFMGVRTESGPGSALDRIVAPSPGWQLVSVPSRANAPTTVSFFALSQTGNGADFAIAGPDVQATQ